MPASPNYKAYAQQLNQRLYPAVKIEWNGVGTKWYSETGFSTPDEDIYDDEGATGDTLTGFVTDPRVRAGTISPVNRTIKLTSFNVPLNDMTVDLIDTDQAISGILEGPYDQRGVVVELWMVSPDLSIADFNQRFTGIVDSWDYGEGFITIKFRNNDTPLRNTAIPTLSLMEGEFANADADAIGAFFPYTYGKIDSTGITGNGFLSGIPIDWDGTSKSFVVCLGSAGEITKAYLDGNLKTLTTHYTVDYNYVKSGKRYTVVTFNAASGAASGSSAAFDILGYDTVGDGNGTTKPTGDPITNPVMQLRHLLNNFVYAEYRDAEWLDVDEDVAPIDLGSWNQAADWAARFEIQGSMRIGGTTNQVRANTIINRWLRSFPMFKLYWNELGKLAMKIIDIAEIVPYADPNDAAFDGKIIEPVFIVGRSQKFLHDTTYLTKSVTTEHLYSPKDGEAFASLVVESPNQDENVNIDFNLQYGAGSAT
jgi:hypothetical protein